MYRANNGSRSHGNFNVAKASESFFECDKTKTKIAATFKQLATVRESKLFAVGRSSMPAFADGVAFYYRTNNKRIIARICFIPAQVVAL